MRILMLSKALVSGPYQKKCEELAALPGVELTVAVPEAWREPRVGTRQLERRHTSGYRLESIAIALNGHHHTHFYPALGRLVASVRPEIFHIDEESFNLATYLAMRAGVRHGARCCFYNYANIDRRYPPPFRQFERYAFTHATHALAANHEAAEIIGRHGYTGPITTIPQFGVDPTIFSPRDDEQWAVGHGSQRPASYQDVVIGYIGRLVPEKGVLDLVEALALLPEYARLRIIGDGTQRGQLEAKAAALGVSGRIELRAWTDDVAAELRGLDVLALPSHTTRGWKEQFGRILVEAMSCGVPVVGSSSGEIPHVVGEAGLIFPEGDVIALSRRLRLLADQPALRAEFGRRGRARILADYTQAALARRYLGIYEGMMADDQNR
jgi:glycosyltransferase involved in cell wall biosynthesis